MFKCMYMYIYIDLWVFRTALGVWKYILITLFQILFCLAFISHLKCALGDPGAVPLSKNINNNNINININNINIDDTLLFKHKRDRKIINPSPAAAAAGDNSKRINLITNELMHVVIFDHTCRKKC